MHKQEGSHEFSKPGRGGAKLKKSGGPSPPPPMGPPPWTMP